MSDIFLSSGVAVDRSLIARALRFTDYTQVESGAVAGLTWAVSRVDDFALWGPAWDPESQTRVLLGGRIALEESEWSAAERLPYRGGLAARHLLSQWLTRGATGVADYNGAALVVIIDEREGDVHIWTDRMGFFPAFVSDDKEVIVASHPDVIARVRAATGRPLDIDDVTIAEFLHTGSPFHTHTYWRGVRHLDAASQFHLNFLNDDSGIRLHNRYWRPAFLEGEAPMSRGAFVEAFADAFRAAGRRRSLGRLGRPAILLSAGADSRGVLAAMRSPSEVECYTYFDEPNDELRGAQKIAALANAQHIALQRSPDYYIANAEETVRLSGGMWGIAGGHHTGFARTITETSGPGTLLTGEFCDMLFKGQGLNRRHLQLLGRNLPLHQLSAFDHEYYLPFAAISPAWAARVSERLEDGVPPALQRDADPRRVEFARLSPLSRYGAASSILVLWRTSHFDCFVADNDILEAYGRLSVPDKISGIAFGQAIARVTGRRIAAIPNNNFGAPVGTGEAGRVLAFMLASSARKLKGAVGFRTPDNPASVATVGSWPDLTRVALNSPLMRQWFEEVRQRHGEFLLQFLHPICRSWTFEDFATQDQFQLYRLITVSLWLRQTQQPNSATLLHDRSDSDVHSVATESDLK